MDGLQCARQEAASQQEKTDDGSRSSRARYWLPGRFRERSTRAVGGLLWVRLRRAVIIFKSGPEYARREPCSLSIYHASPPLSCPQGASRSPTRSLSLLILCSPAASKMSMCVLSRRDDRLPICPLPLTIAPHLPPPHHCSSIWRSTAIRLEE